MTQETKDIIEQHKYVVSQMHLVASHLDAIENDNKVSKQIYAHYTRYIIALRHHELELRELLEDLGIKFNGNDYLEVVDSIFTGEPIELDINEKENNDNNISNNN